jgi:hypothetical protein
MARQCERSEVEVFCQVVREADRPGDDERMRQIAGVLREVLEGNGIELVTLDGPAPCPISQLLGIVEVEDGFAIRIEPLDHGIGPDEFDRLVLGTGFVAFRRPCFPGEEPES